MKLNQCNMPYQKKKKKKKGKHYEIISVEGEKNTWLNPTPFHDKKKKKKPQQNKSRREENHLNIIKVIY